MAEPTLAAEPQTAAPSTISRTIMLAVALVSFSSLLFPKSRTRRFCG